jgi:hypothetical protein
MEIDLEATKCPHCQTDQRGLFGRHPIITSLITMFIVLGIIGSIGNKKYNPPDVSKVVSKIDTNTPLPEQPEELTPKVGDVTELGDREFIVNSVRRSRGFGYNTPKSGKEYVIVNVSIRNLGTGEVSYNPYDFKVQDANGAQEGITYASLDDSLNSGTLAPGGKVTGSMPFEVPVGDNAKLIYQSSFWSNQRVVVDLGNI